MLFLDVRSSTGAGGRHLTKVLPTLGIKFINRAEKRGSYQVSYISRRLLQ